MNNYYMIEDNSKDNSNGKLFVVAVTVEQAPLLPPDLSSSQTPSPGKVVIDGAENDPLLPTKMVRQLNAYMFRTLTSFFSVLKLNCLNCNCLCKKLTSEDTKTLLDASKDDEPDKTPKVPPLSSEDEASLSSEDDEPDKTPKVPPLPSSKNGEDDVPPLPSSKNGEDDAPPLSNSKNGEDDAPPSSLNYKLAMKQYEAQEAICDQAFDRLSEFKLFVTMQRTNMGFTEFKADYTKMVQQDTSIFFRIIMRDPGYKLLDGFYDGMEADTFGTIMSNGATSRIVRFWKEIKGDSFTLDERKQIETAGSVPKHTIWGNCGFVGDSTTPDQRDEFKKDMLKGINTATQVYKDEVVRLNALNFKPSYNEGDEQPIKWKDPEIRRLPTGFW